MSPEEKEKIYKQHWNKLNPEVKKVYIELSKVNQLSKNFNKSQKFYK